MTGGPIATRFVMNLSAHSSSCSRLDESRSTLFQPAGRFICSGNKDVTESHKALERIRNTESHVKLIIQTDYFMGNSLILISSCFSHPVPFLSLFGPFLLFSFLTLLFNLSYFLSNPITRLNIGTVHFCKPEIMLELLLFLCLWSV